MKKQIISFVLVLAMLIGFVPAAVLPASAAAMEASESVIFMIQGFEGFRSEAYRDSNGQWLIGYGTSSEEGATITREEADRVMRAQVDTLETAVNSFASNNRLSLSQTQFDALISFSFNCGTGWMNIAGKFRSAVINRATGNDFLYAICLWANAGSVPSTGLISRRLAEANLYLNGRYSTTPPSNYTYVLFDANGGSVGEDKMQGFDTNVPAPVKVTPTHTNGSLRFAGWFTARSNGAKVTTLTSANAAKTLYALWGLEVKVTNAYVNVRNAPGVVGTAPIGRLNMDDKVVIFETATVNGALWGRFDGGWISLDYTNYDMMLEAQKQNGSGNTSGETIVATAMVSCSDFVNVRNAPGTVGTKVVGKLASGTKVEIYEIRTVIGHKWGRIAGGWFCLDYAIISSGSFDDTSTGGNTGGTGTGSGSSKPSEPVLRTGTVSGTFVNVRNGPGTVGTSVKYQLRQGEKVSFYEFRTVNKHQWGRINKNEWICMDYVTLDPENSGNTGSTGTVPFGTVTFPMDTPIYNAGGTRIATANAGTTMSVFNIHEDEISGKLYYQVAGGYVEMEGLEVTLAAAVSCKAKNDVKAYDTPGDMTSELATLRKDAVITVTRLMLKSNVLWAYTSDNYVDGWVNILDLEVMGPAGGSTGGNTGNTGSTGGNTGGTPSETVLRTGFVNNTYVNVRNAPGTVGTTVIDKLNSGAKVNIYEFREINKKQWARIGTNRWVCMDYITLDPQGSSGTPGGSTGGNTGTPETPTGNTIATGFVTSNTLNIRSGPGLGYATAGSLSKNNRFYVYEYKLKDNMIWGRIGTNKWICLSYTLLDSTGTVTGNGEMGTIIKTYSAANIRSGPGSGYALMGKMLVNSRVEILEIKPGNGTNWGRTSMGWISMEYVMLDSQLPPGMIPDGGSGSTPGGNTGSTGGNTGTTPGGSTGGNTGTTPGGNTGTTPGGSTGNGSTAPLYTGVVILTNALKIRQAPTTSAMELGTLARNTRVTIYELAVGNGMAWGRCDKGWISLTYIDLVPASGNGAVDARVVQYDGLNIRETPGTRSKSLGTYSKGTVVDIFEFSGNWGRTKDGWVSLDYLLT